jgi:hypothetical protein
MNERVLGKIEVSGLIGEQLDDALQLAENEVQQRKGMQFGCQAAGKAIAGLLPHIDKSCDEGEFDGLEGIELRNAVKKWIVRANDAVENLYKRAQAEEMAAHGKASAMKTAVTIVQRYHNAASARHAQLTAPPEPDDEAEDNKGRRPGERPAPSPLDKRRRAAAAEAADKTVSDAIKKAAAKKVPAKKRALKKKTTAKKRGPKKGPKKGA